MSWKPESDVEKLMFRPLDDAEELQFETYAELNDPDPDKWSVYHPVCRRVWERRGFSKEGRE